LTPLLRSDPQRLGDVSLTGRLDVTDAGIVYAGLLAQQPVAVALLNAGAELDSYARARFHDAVRDASTLADDLTVVAAEDDPEIAPWVAVRAESWDDGAKLAVALLAPVTLEHLDPVAPARGPRFRPHWDDRPEPGRWRVWPLPWPSTFSAAGRWTYLASFALVVAIASIALFIAVKLFENQPPAPVPPPYPVPTPTIPTPSQSPTPTPTPTPTGPGGPSRSHSTGKGGAPFV
jgi:hypothetical protein